jgi:hypothetical protein
MNPSLIITPNAVDEGKLFSIVPTDVSGDLDVVRATTATRVNEDGLIESVGVNVPRLDYSNGSCPSILIEPQRTNLALQSESMSSFSRFGNTLPTNVRNISSTDPSNNFNSTTVTGGDGSSGVFGIFRFMGEVIAAGSPVTYSVFAKKGTNNFIFIYHSNVAFTGTNGAYFDLNNGTTPTSGASIIPYPNGWYRCILPPITFNSAPSSAYNIGHYVTPNTSTASWSTNFLDKSVIFYGGQLEEGLNATSYIPTTLASVTRNTDVISKTGITDLIGQTKGTIFVDFNNTKVDSVSRYIFSMYDSASFFDNNIEILISNLNQLLLSSRSSGTTQVSYNNGNEGLQKYKIIYKYEENNTKIFINGTLVRTDLLCIIPPMNSINLGARNNLTSPLNDGVNSLTIYKTLLTDQECINLTTI